jgi:hypothetical protein
MMQPRGKSKQFIREMEVGELETITESLMHNLCIKWYTVGTHKQIQRQRKFHREEEQEVGRGLGRHE